MTNGDLLLQVLRKSKDNELGEEILSRYEWVDCVFCDDRARVLFNDKNGFIDTGGREICPIKYDEADFFYNGFAGVCIDGKWGFINKDGEEICPLIYDEIIHPFQDGVTVARLGEKLCVIDFRELK
jgi:hypothetical protein